MLNIGWSETIQVHTVLRTRKQYLLTSAGQQGLRELLYSCLCDAVLKKKSKLFLSFKLSQTLSKLAASTAYIYCKRSCGYCDRKTTTTTTTTTQASTTESTESPPETPPTPPTPPTIPSQRSRVRHRQEQIPINYNE